MRKYLGFLAVTGLATLPALSMADTPTLGDVLKASDISVSGDVQASYTHGFNDGQTLVPREFDSAGDSFTFNQALLNISSVPTDGFGAATTFVAGDDAKVISNTYGDGSGNFALNQAYLSYAHGPLTIIAGRYNTLSGAEVIQASANSNFSRSLLYFLAEPFVHTGVRASYVVGGTTLYLGAANTVYNGVATDINKQKAIEAGVGLPALGPVTLAAYNYYSVDNTTGNSSKENLTDFVATITATDKLTFILNGDLNHGFGDGGSYNIYGLAGYANYTINDKWKASLRGELLRLRDACTDQATGTTGSCNLSEITATIGYSPVANFTILGEFRDDMNTTDAKYFTPKDSSQPDVAVTAIYSF